MEPLIPSCDEESDVSEATPFYENAPHRLCDMSWQHEG